MRCETTASCEQSACPCARARALLSAAKMFGSWLLFCSKWALIVSSSCFVRFRPLEILWRLLTRHLGAGVTCDGSEDDGKTGSRPVLHVNPLHERTTQHTGCACVCPRVCPACTSCSLVNEPHTASAQRSAWSGGFSQSSTKQNPEKINSSSTMIELFNWTEKSLISHSVPEF